MLRRCSLAAVLAGLALASAPAAAAHGIATVALDKASYQPGDAVVVSGVFVDPDFAVVTEPVTVRIGIDGPVVGQAPVAADGTWTLTFAVPAETVLGAYALHAEVLDASGSLVKNLIALATLQVGPPPASLAAAAPATSEDVVPAHGAPYSGVAPAPVAVEPASVALAAPQAARVRVQRQRLVARASSAPSILPAPQPRRLAAPVVRQHRPAAARHVEPRSSPAAQPVSRSHTAERELRPAPPSGAAQRPATASRRSLPVALLLLTLGIAAAAIVALRGRRLLTTETDQELRSLEIEAELQEMVAEELARRSAQSGPHDSAPRAERARR